MNLEDLRAAQVDERGTDSLQPLPATFYEQAADYLADLRARRDRLAERADDPFGSDEVRRLTDELETAAEVVEALYERRVGKIVKRASLAAAGMPADEEGLTEEERVLFTDLVERIEANREAVLAALAARDADCSVEDAATSRSASEPPREASLTRGGTDEAESAASGDAPSPADRQDAAADGSVSVVEATEEQGDAVPGEPDEPDRLTVRITADVGEIYGVDDRVYTLGSEDVVTLPSANAKPLLERGAAERVD